MTKEIYRLKDYVNAVRNNEDLGNIVLQFGKHAGKKASEVPEHYYDWAVRTLIEKGEIAPKESMQNQDTQTSLPKLESDTPRTESPFRPRDEKFLMLYQQMKEKSIQKQRDIKQESFKNKQGWYCSCGYRLRDKKPESGEEYCIICPVCKTDHSWGT
jgi:hypothetical protein